MTTTTRDELITLTAAAVAAGNLEQHHRYQAGAFMQGAARVANDLTRQVYLEWAEEQAAEAYAAELEARHLRNQFVRAHKAVTR